MWFHINYIKRSDSLSCKQFLMITHPVFFGVDQLYKHCRGVSSCTTHCQTAAPSGRKPRNSSIAGRFSSSSEGLGFDEWWDTSLQPTNPSNQKWNQTRSTQDTYGFNPPENPFVPCFRQQKNTCKSPPMLIALPRASGWVIWKGLLMATTS